MTAKALGLAIPQSLLLRADHSTSTDLLYPRPRRTRWVLRRWDIRRPAFSEVLDHCPPSLSATKGQTATQQETDAKDCDHQVHNAGRPIFIGMLTAWSEKEREDYVACMKGKGYTATK